MQFDNLDNKVQDAAERFYPVYDEQAWRKMEILLNREMPQDHQCRRTLLRFALFIFMLVLGGTRLLYRQLHVARKPMPPLTAMPVALPVRNHTSRKEEAAPTVFANEPIATASKKNAFDANTSPPLAGRKMFLQTSRLTASDIGNNVAAGQEISLPATISTAGDKWNDMRVLPDDLTRKEFGSGLVQGQCAVPLTVFENQHSGKRKNLTAGEGMQVLLSNDQNAETNENKAGNSISLNVSAGAEVSAVSIGKIGNVNPVFGATIGYGISRKWNIRAGFFKTKKVYRADAADYHPPSEFWTGYPYLESIDAKCTVIEMPFVIEYMLKKTLTAGYFSAVGLSSYLMKQETYHYVSERPGQPYQSDTDNHNNQNKHYLSSMRLSFGYAKKMNQRLTVTAELYLNLPLRGIGFGKVRLTSGGVLLTLGLKPFGKR